MNDPKNNPGHAVLASRLLFVIAAASSVYAEPTGTATATRPAEDPPSLEVGSLTLIAPPEMNHPLRYAIDQLAELCRVSAGFELKRSDVPADAGITLLLGREMGETHAPALAAGIDWKELGPEGFVLRTPLGDRTGSARQGVSVLAAGQTDAGTRHAIIELMRRLDLSRLPARLPAGLNLVTRPDFGLRGMYAHQHWAYHYPYALRTWKVQEWKQYVDILALLHLNLFQIWSMAGSLPAPFSPEDEAWLRRYPPVIDHARQNHGMEVWIGECANNMVDASRRAEMPPVPQRDYFEFELLKNPADPAQMQELRAHRAAFYRVCNNADGYWVIDSDPGGWKGSPSSEFVDILMMNRELISQHTQPGPKAKLIYWMWFGWGTARTPAEKWQATLTDLIARNPAPWLLTVAGPDHWSVTDPLGIDDRIIYYPYNAVEHEPSLPFTTLIPDRLRRHMDVPERVGRIPGVMANAQTPIVQWPNIHYFANCAWDLNRRRDGAADSVYQLASWIYPEHARLLADAWLSIGDPDAPLAEAYADRLEELERSGQLGRPGPIGIKLFPDYGQVARDLAAQLRVHAAAMHFCRAARNPDTPDAQLLELLTRYCLRSLAWRRHTGYNKHGTNGANFFPVREAAHRRWWKDNRLDPAVYTAIKNAMETQFEAWEAELILQPLRE